MNVHGFAGAVFTVAVVIGTADLLTHRWGAMMATLTIAVLAGLLWEATDGRP